MIKTFKFGLLELEATSVRGGTEVLVLNGCLERVRFCCAALQLYGHLYSTRPSVPTSPSELQARQGVLESIIDQMGLLRHRSQKTVGVGGMLS